MTTGTKRTLIAALGLAMVLPAATASAQQDHPTARQVFDEDKAFSGFYLGLEAGYDHGKAGPDYSAVERGPSEGGQYIGAVGGYRYQFSMGIVLGAEYAAGYSTVKDTGTVDSFGLPMSVTLDHGFQDRLAFTAGFAVANKHLLYGALGVKFAEVNGSEDTVLGGGIGYEYAWKKHARFRLSAYQWEDFNFLFGPEVRQKMITASLIHQF